MQLKKIIFFLGISATSLYLELFSYSIMMSYNYCNRYSILSYMEYPILLFQEYILIYLVLKYKGQLDSNAYKFAGAYFFALSLFLTNIIPTFILAMLVVSFKIKFLQFDSFAGLVWSNTDSKSCEFLRKKKHTQSSCFRVIKKCFFLQPFCTPIGATSKVIQLVEILRTKNASSVNLTTWLISAFTNLSEYGNFFFNLILLRTN